MNGKFKAGTARLTANLREIVLIIENGEAFTVNITEVLELISGKETYIDILGNRQLFRRAET